MTLRLAAIATSTVVCGTLAARGRHDLAPEHPLTEAERSSGSRSAPYSRAPCTVSRWLIMFARTASAVSLATKPTRHITQRAKMAPCSSRWNMKPSTSAAGIGLQIVSSVMLKLPTIPINISANWHSHGIHLVPFEQAEIGPDPFRHGCRMGLEGLVSKHRDSIYRAGRTDRWIKNRQHAALNRVMDAFG